MKSLKQLIAGRHTDKDTTHSYADEYEKLFAPRRSSALQVLEVGVCHGGSVLLWRDYFEGAEVTGVDLKLDLLRPPLSAGGANPPDRVRLIAGDAYSPQTIAALSDRLYDVAVDDGPHTLESMKTFAASYAPLLAPGGVLVIEDVQDIAWVDQIRESFPEALRDRVRVVDLRGNKNRYDDILVVLDLLE